MQRKRRIAFELWFQRIRMRKKYRLHNKKKKPFENVSKPLPLPTPIDQKLALAGQGRRLFDTPYPKTMQTIPKAVQTTASDLPTSSTDEEDAGEGSDIVIFRGPQD